MLFACCCCWQEVLLRLPLWRLLGGAGSATPRLGGFALGPAFQRRGRPCQPNKAWGGQARHRSKWCRCLHAGIPVHLTVLSSLPTATSALETGAMGHHSGMRRADLEAASCTVKSQCGDARVRLDPLILPPA